MNRGARIVLVGLAVILVDLAPSWGQDRPGAIALPTRSQILDPAGMFTPAAEEEARRKLQTLELETSVPVLIQVVESLDGLPIEEATLKAARQAGDTGVFVLIARHEKKLWLLVRRQFRHRLPEDRQAAVREAIMNAFQKGDFDNGLMAGVAALADALRTTGGEVGTSSLVTRNHLKLGLAGANVILEAAEAKAVEKNWKVNIAVVDEGGHLIAFARMDGARPASAATAQTKAVSAATYRQPSGPFPPGSSEPNVLLSLGIAAAADSGGARVSPLFGGVPIEVEGQIIGAVGVGGGTGEQDAEVARAGISALLEKLSNSTVKPLGD